MQGFLDDNDYVGAIRYLKALNEKSTQTIYDDGIIKALSLFAMLSGDESLNIFINSIPRISVTYVYRNVLANIEKLSIEENSVASFIDYSFLSSLANVTEISIKGNQTITADTSSSKLKECKKIDLSDFTGAANLNAIFELLPNIEEVYLPKATDELPPYVFYQCPDIKKITLPKNVSIIGKNAFNPSSDVKIYAKKNQKISAMKSDAEFLKSHIIRK